LNTNNCLDRETKQKKKKEEERDEYNKIRQDVCRGGKTVLFCALSVSLLWPCCRYDTKSGEERMEQTFLAMEETQDPSLDADFVPKSDDEQFFVSLSNTTKDDEDEMPVKIQRSKTGKVRMVYGERIRIPLSSLGCTSASITEKARCALESMKDSFDIESTLDELNPLNVRTNSRGNTVVLFSQKFEEVMVFGGFISVQITPAGEIVQIYSTMATPISGPTASNIGTAQASADVEAAMTTLTEKTASSQQIQLHSVEPMIYPKLENGAYTAIPAIGVKSQRADSGRLDMLGVFDANTGALLDQRNLRNDTPYAKLYGTSLPGHMDRHSWHPTCNTDRDCTTSPNLYCSDHFSPKRCVGKCMSDSDCTDYGYKCFVPPDSGELEGYCYKDNWYALELLVYDGAFTSWYSYALEDQKAFSRAQDSLEEVIDHHLYDMNINGWDDSGSDYPVHFITEDSEESSDPRAAWSESGHVYYTGWYRSWSGTSNGDIHGQEHTMGHEWGHNMMGAACSWCSPPAAKHCLHEGLPVQFGELYVARRMDPSDMWYEGSCGAQTGIYIDDRSGLGSATSCKSEYIPYAHRSRFDWLSCDEGNSWWGQTCNVDEDCPTYTLCRKYSQSEHRCTDAPYKYHQTHVMTRMLRIMALGPSAFSSDQYPQDIDIPNSPIGRVTTTQIIHDANTQTNTGTTLEDWMNLVLSSSSFHGKYAETAAALGASGFFPKTTTIASYVTDKTPTKILFSGYNQSTNKNLTFWKQPTTGRIRYKYYIGSTAYYGLINTNTDSRPVVVEWGNYLHVFFRNASDGTIRVALMSTSGTIYGPYSLRSEFTPNGDFDAAVYNGYLYLVFADSNNSNYATVAKCSASICYQSSSWYDFGGGNHKKVISTASFSPGLAAVAASRVNGVSSSMCVTFNENLYIAASYYGSKMLWILRVDTNDDLLTSYSYASHHPSYQTDGTIGLTVRDSAFDQTCMMYYPGQGFVPVDTPRRYLYLTWKEYGGDRVFTSVLQNADPADRWLTISVDTLSETKSGTGVTWARGVGPDEDQNIIKANPSNGVVQQLHGYGKY
jgi:hypothetical protein